MKSDIENKEWLKEFEALKQVNTANPFTVPSGYFEELDQRIISSIRIEEHKEAGDFKGLTVPPGYFEELTDQIRSRIGIEEALANAEGDFTVPQNYFEELTGNIQSRIAIEEFLGHTEPGFSVPQNYFEEMEQQIQSRITVEESMAAAETGFSVPEGYFEELNHSIINRTASYETDKRRGIVRKLFASAAFKYASAACLALFIGAGIFITQIESPEAKHDRSYLHKALFSVPDNEIENYLQLHMDASDTKTLLDHAEQGNIKNSNDLQYDLSID